MGKRQLARVLRVHGTGKQVAPRCFVWVTLGDQSPKPPGIYRFEASPK